MPDVRAFYHAWLDGAWERPHFEFGQACAQSGFPAEVVVNWSRATSEAPTINLVRDYALENDGVVLYAHTKGAATVEPFRDRWRRSMTARVVARWRENLALLEDHDAVGCHWLTEAEYPGMFGTMTVPADGSGFFGGNFWMARCDYLRTLPPCKDAPRWQAEQWIGINHPRVVDLLPGWPHDNRWPELCG
ncbi:MAG: hypothetical protein JO130_18575 [Solirubrobacterales bacterium]|nr:hypothetical protein [Solirubrobacterales bacterium]